MTKERLNAWMQLMGYNDRMVGEKMDVDPALVWRVRTGERQATDGFAWRFAQAYGYELANRIFGDKEKVTA